MSAYQISIQPGHIARHTPRNAGAQGREAAVVDIARRTCCCASCRRTARWPPWSSREATDFPRLVNTACRSGAR